MKRRIRTLLRAGWHLVEVKSIVAQYDWKNEENTSNYQTLVKWCIDNVPEHDWQSSLHSDFGTSKPCVKRFVFKDEKYAAWFRLMTTSL